MPKMKTHKGVLKRFKVSARGKVRHKRAGAGHLMSHKSGDRCRRMRQPRAIKPALGRLIKEVLGNAGR